MLHAVPGPGSALFLGGVVMVNAADDEVSGGHSICVERLGFYHKRFGLSM